MWQSNCLILWLCTTTVWVHYRPLPATSPKNFVGEIRIRDILQCKWWQAGCFITTTGSMSPWLKSRVGKCVNCWKPTIKWCRWLILSALQKVICLTAQWSDWCRAMRRWPMRKACSKPMKNSRLPQWWRQEVPLKYFLWDTKDSCCGIRKCRKICPRISTRTNGFLWIKVWIIWMNWW